MSGQNQPGQLPIDGQIAQLEAAKGLVLQDPSFYPDIVRGILPIVTAPNALKELKRWGADFLAETFSSPVLNATTKQSMALSSLDSLLALVNETEGGILKNAISCAATIYPLIFRHICSNRNDSESWRKMTAIKSRILKVWDRTSEGVRLACIKFVQKVILVQTPGTADPRLADKSEVSLTNVPLNHPLIPHPQLEAEAQGLLDRLLSVLQQDRPDVPAVNATLNCLPVLIKTRTTIANKILNGIINFDPFTIVMKGNNPKDKFSARSMEKTARQVLINLVRASPAGPNVQRISAQVNRLMQGQKELLSIDDTSKKRGAPGSSNESAKRPRTEQESSTTPPAPPIQLQPSNGTTYSTLYTLTNDMALSSFDVTQLPVEIAVQITLATLFAVPQQKLDAATATVRSRYNSLLQAARALPPPRPPQPPKPAATQQFEVADALGDTTPSLSSEESDEYEVRDSEPIATSGSQKAQQQDDSSAANINNFNLGNPQNMSPEELKEAGEATVDRIVGNIDEIEREAKAKAEAKAAEAKAKAANRWHHIDDERGFDREGWTILLCRLATRGLGSIEDLEESQGHYLTPRLSDVIREKLYDYIMKDFRHRLDMAATWLNEEWYNDKMCEQYFAKGKDYCGNLLSKTKWKKKPEYPKWMMKVLDSIFPYLEASDRIFIRFLSDLPELPPAVIENLGQLCLDPERASLGFLTLHYMIMLRPPVRKQCMDVIYDLYNNHPDVKAAAKKIILKFDPNYIYHEQLNLPAGEKAKAAYEAQQKAVVEKSAAEASAATPASAVGTTATPPAQTGAEKPAE